LVGFKLADFAAGVALSFVLEPILDLIENRFIDMVRGKPYLARRRCTPVGWDNLEGYLASRISLEMGKKQGDTKLFEG
jgi:hypothetical protein